MKCTPRRVIKLSNAIWEDGNPNPIMETELVVNNNTCVRVVNHPAWREVPPLIHNTYPNLSVFVPFLNALVGKKCAMTECTMQEKNHLHVRFHISLPCSHTLPPSKFSR